MFKLTFPSHEEDAKYFNNLVNSLRLELNDINNFFKIHPKIKWEVPAGEIDRFVKILEKDGLLNSKKNGGDIFVKLNPIGILFMKDFKKDFVSNREYIGYERAYKISLMKDKMESRLSIPIGKFIGRSLNDVMYRLSLYSNEDSRAFKIPQDIQMKVEAGTKEVLLQFLEKDGLLFFVGKDIQFTKKGLSFAESFRKHFNLHSNLKDVGYEKAYEIQLEGIMI